MSSGNGITSGKDWRAAREQGISVTFRSGNTARIRPVGLDLLVKTGRVPNVLEPMVVQLIETGRADTPASASLEDESAWFDFLNCLCELAFVQPRVVAEPQTEDEIGVWDISLSDKMQLWEVLGTPARMLASHFRQQETALAHLGTSEVHPSTGEQNPGDRALGQSNAGDGRPSDGADVR
jgi:hypothetical protein